LTYLPEKWNVAAPGDVYGNSNNAFPKVEKIGLRKNDPNKYYFVGGRYTSTYYFH
jgi:hypothetical protein